MIVKITINRRIPECLYIFIIKVEFRSVPRCTAISYVQVRAHSAAPCQAMQISEPLAAWARSSTQSAALLKSSARPTLTSAHLITSHLSGVRVRVPLTSHPSTQQHKIT